MVVRYLHNIFKSMDKRRVTKIFLIAVGVRVLFSLFRGEAPNAKLIDEKEYFYNGRSLEVIYNPSSEGRNYDYKYWYNRTPFYMMFNYLLQGWVVPVQIFLSSIGVVLLYLLNKKAGWVWCFYLPDVFYSFHYLKFSLMTFLIIAGVYLWSRINLKRVQRG